MKRAITYYRVSTERQGISGLGLDAQKQAVRDFAASNGFQLLEEFIEVESSRNKKRPMLLQALSACKARQATLLIARLDRLARSVAFISRLTEAGVDFKAVDNPHAGKLVVHIMAAFAEHERDLISQRTADALQAARNRGVQLGTYGRNVLSVYNRQKADHFALSLLPTIRAIQHSGITTIRAITKELNRLEVPTYCSGGQWHINTVHSVLQRLGRIA